MSEFAWTDSVIIENEHIWRALDELDTNALVFVDTRGRIRDINRGVTTLFGYGTHELVGKKLDFLLPGDLRELHNRLFSDYVRRRQQETRYKSKIVGVQRCFPEMVDIQFDSPKRFTAIHRDKREIPITLTINEVLSDSNALIGFIAIIRDNTEQFRLQKELKYQAAHDRLTGLVNWQEFERQMSRKKRMIIERGEDYQASILFLDVDYFMVIKYQSQIVADFAIKKMATWLLNQARGKDRFFDAVITRYIGDKFIICLSGTALNEALALAGHLKSNFRRLNLRTAENPFFSSISIGAANMTHSTLLQDAVSRASNACRLARRKGGDKIKVAREEDSRHLNLEPVIRDALENRRLMLYAQRIVAISPRAKAIDNGNFHFEVLVRIRDKNGDIISPVLFIPAAEKLGLAMEIDEYVIENALKFFKKNAGLSKSLSLCSINLSGVSVSNERMRGIIENQICKSAFDPGKLCFEVTETHQIQDNDIAGDTIKCFRKMGCKFAFDDFGIGYSNYQSLLRLPVDIIKIDGSYIRSLLKDRQLGTDVEGMINSAKSRGLETVAEFAENEEIVGKLERLGVDYAQGYHYGKPVPLEDMLSQGGT